MKNEFYSYLSYVKLVTIIALTVVMTACGSTTDHDSTNTLSFNELTLAEHEELLRKRHSERWAAVVRVDFDTVYEFATPQYRSIYSRTHLHNQYGAQIIRKSARIASLTFDEDDMTLAHINTALTFATVMTNGEMYQDEIILKDKWRFVDGQWWYVEPR